MKDERLRRLGENSSRIERAVLSRATKRYFVDDETALRGRRNGTLRATKRYFVDDETALSRPSKRNATGIGE